MSLNSNVFIPSGMDVATRAALLGHSIQTNLKYYSFAQKDHVENAREILDSINNDALRTPKGPHNIISFSEKEKPQSTNLSVL